MLGPQFHTMILAQVFGLYLLIMSVIMVCRVEFYRAMINKIKIDSGAVMIGASFGLMLGLFLVDIHNFWVLRPRLIVTIFSWLILLKSILWLTFPDKALAMSKKLYAGVGYYFVVFIMFLFALFFLTRGYYIFL